MNILNKLREKLKFLFVDNCNCVICDSELACKNKYGLCEKCMADLPRNGGKICEKCGKSINNESLFCTSCQNTSRYFDYCRSALIYRDEVAKLLLRYKFHNKRYLAKYLSPYLIDTIEKYNLKFDMVVPVPLSIERLEERGYNQVEELLKYINFDKPIIRGGIAKIKHTEQQSKLTGKKRRENLKGAYKLIDKDIFNNKVVLVIDDVITTGSTADEVARIIKKGGAKEVIVITIATAEYKVRTEELVDVDFIDETINKEYVYNPFTQH